MNNFKMLNFIILLYFTSVTAWGQTSGGGVPTLTPNMPVTTAVPGTSATPSTSGNQGSMSPAQLKEYFEKANKQVDTEEDKNFLKEQQKMGVFRHQNYDDMGTGSTSDQDTSQTFLTPNIPGMPPLIQPPQTQNIGIPNTLSPTVPSDQSEKSSTPSLIDARESAFQDGGGETTTISIVDDPSISVDMYAKKYPLMESSVPLPDFSYDPTGRRDPFRPYKIFKKESRQIIDPLIQYDLSAFKVVGVLWNVKKPKAIVLAPNGKRYIIEKNTKIGRKDGYVVAIRESEVLVIETFEAEDRTVRSIKSLVIGKTLGGGNAE